MPGRLLFALLALLNVVHPDSAKALPFGGTGDALLPALFRALNARDLANLYRSSGDETSVASSAPDMTAVPAAAFENAASREPGSRATDGRAQGLQDLIAIAGVGTGLHAPGASPAHDSPLFGTASQSSYGTGMSARKQSRVPVSRADPAGPGGHSFFNTIMETQLKADFVRVASKVVTPTVTADGAVAVTLMGLRDFAFVISPVTDRMLVIDFRTGTTITMSDSRNGGTAEPIGLSSQLQMSPSARGQMTIPRLTVSEVLGQARQFVLDYLLHPFTLGALCLFSVFWLVLRIGRRAD